MSARPILFSAPMVRAILDGRKSQTRRIVKPQPADDIARAAFPNPTAIGWRSSRRHEHGSSTAHFCPYGSPGDLLWVRETHHAYRPLSASRGVSKVVYRADDEFLEPGRKWTPSIHMPRWASRITLKVTDVRVERLQAISCADAIAEGCRAVSLHDLDCDSPDPRDEYKALWSSINGPDSWAANPWVWIVSFERVTPAVDEGRG